MSQEQKNDKRTLEETIQEMEAQYEGEDFTTSDSDVEASNAGITSERDIIAKLEEDLSEQRKRELQAQAELENFRKRMIRDSEQSLKYASLPLIRDILDVADNLSRAIEAASKESLATGLDNPLLDGVTMVLQQLRNTLSKYNCIPIEALGKEFDPNYHEAISQSASAEFPKGTVMYEATQGYRLYDRVIRPSQVIVSTGSPN